LPEIIFVFLLITREEAFSVADLSHQDSPKASNTYDLVDFPLKGSWYALKKKKKQLRWQVSTSSMNHERSQF